MTEALKLCAAGVICAMLCVLVREIRPELAPFVQTGGIIVLTVMLFGTLKAMLAQADELFRQLGTLDVSSAELLIKILGIAVITKIGADICVDNGNEALASAVELGGKLTILFCCFSLIKVLAELAGGLLV